MKASLYTGLIVEESLEDSRILNTFKILHVEITKDLKPEDRWHIYTVEASQKEIEKLSKWIKPTLWFVHFWRQNELLVVFPNKIFSLERSNEKNWKEAIGYGLALGIPRKQLNFKSGS